jgi:hypothetical protein
MSEKLSIATADSPTTSWTASPLNVYSPGNTDLVLASSTYGNGARLRFNQGYGVDYGFGVVDLTGATYVSLRAGQITSQMAAPASAEWHAGPLCSYVTGGGHPFVGFGGTTYGGSLRLNQSTAGFELLDGVGTAYQRLYCGGVTFPSYGANSSTTIEYYNSYGRSSYEFSSCDGSYHYHNIYTPSAGFIFRHDGNAYAVAWVDTSDRREKENFAPVESALAKALKLEPVSFNFLGRKDRSVGLVAQDVLEVLPEAVSEFPKDGESRFGTSYSAIATLAIGAIKELTARLEAAEARIAQLEAKVV